MKTIACLIDLLSGKRGYLLEKTRHKLEVKLSALPHPWSHFWNWTLLIRTRRTLWQFCVVYTFKMHFNLSVFAGQLLIVLYIAYKVPRIYVSVEYYYLSLYFVPLSSVYQLPHFLLYIGLKLSFYITISFSFLPLFYFPSAYIWWYVSLYIFYGSSVLLSFFSFFLQCSSLVPIP